jgi:hypothetical protein
VDEEPLFRGTGRAAKDLCAGGICAQEGKEKFFTLLCRYDVEAGERTERLSYADLGRELDLPVTQVTNGLHWARIRLRACVLLRLRELTVDDDEFRAEARAMLGVDPG